MTNALLLAAALAASEIFSQAPVENPDGFKMLAQDDKMLVITRPSWVQRNGNQIIYWTITWSKNDIDHFKLSQSQGNCGNYSTKAIVVGMVDTKGVIKQRHIIENAEWEHPTPDMTQFHVIDQICKNTSDDADDNSREITRADYIT